MIELQTKSGHLVARFNTLAKAMMPPPEIVQWGARFFTRTIQKTEKKGQDKIIYREGMMYPLVPGITAEPIKIGEAPTESELTSPSSPLCTEPIQVSKEDLKKIQVQDKNPVIPYDEE